ncbi:MBL fold metallo-hydrolase [Mucilaginibacter ginkgonis]|uniref:MBL fold metallo-hydrolase n=1 Tax=Mucilaginibacter ginkgonis TaxID=2682091 RepID=A0A6I4IN43_9SPHI|nr:MBL fold metallo-hydrolase [Mucilaginibacter ginkgonis]QQL51123.1 MBL fold metallo-hydrolase [Mucilaginibacter ginkgonis]
MIKKNNVSFFQVAQGVWGMKLTFVNIYMIANRRGVAKGWVLVDTGPKHSADKIIAMAEALFGVGTRPSAIVLTHGHSDHTGSLEDLLKHWKVPVYAHKLEIPYLTGRASYPPPDPTVGGGVMSLFSVLFSRKPVDIKGKIKEIDTDEGIPELPEWKVIETPGHSPGHISLFLPLNTTLIAGDAFSTTKPESAIYVLNYIKKISGPPMYFTPDWPSAKRSVETLANLQPRIAAPGHGPVMRGRELQLALADLTENFDEKSVPDSGRYVGDPARYDENGLVYVPPFKVNHKFLAIAAVTGLAVGLIATAGAKKLFN